MEGRKNLNKYKQDKGVSQSSLLTSEVKWVRQAAKKTAAAASPHIKRFSPLLHRHKHQQPRSV